MHDSVMTSKRNVNKMFFIFYNKHVCVVKLYSVLQYCSNYWHTALVTGTHSGVPWLAWTVMDGIKQQTMKQSAHSGLSYLFADTYTLIICVMFIS